MQFKVAHMLQTVQNSSGWFRSGLILLAGAMAACALHAASASADEQNPAQTDPSDDADSRYEFRADHDPNGIGKFYMGREIAYVMGHQAIMWLERPEREREERLTLLIECLHLKPGMVVADIGAGSGVISAMISDRVGPEGTVLAVDIQQEMLDAIAVKCKERGITNIEPVLGTTKSPKLKPESVDLVIMVDVYHEFDFPYEMLREICKSLKPGGRVAFVEYRKEDPTVPIKEVHKMSQTQVKKEAGLPEFGLKFKETVDKLPRQHVIIFERPVPEAAAGEPE
jgi:ubiquinone/menaquinone biosynthesis C-methylase UbiE